MSSINCSAIILAAGKGSRMLSDIPKVLYNIGGKSMLQHVIDSAIRMGVKSIHVVCGYQGDKVMEKINANAYKIPIYWILQHDLFGTGHAVQQALLTPVMHDDNEEVIILYGDVPCISYETLQRLYILKSQCDISMLTAILSHPDGYGRIIRNQLGNVIGIIENSDIVNENQKNIKEINTGIFIATVSCLRYWLKLITVNDIKNEFFLTDVIHIACQLNCIIRTIHPADTFEIIGVNTKLDLVYLEREYQRKQAKYLLSTGVMISDPNRFDLRGTLECGKDVFIDVNVIIEGHVFLGNRVQIGAGCIVKNTVVEDDSVIYPFSILENTKVGFRGIVGPFARLRTGTELKEKSHVGNFVEIKNTVLGKQSKVKHLSYLGDAKIGAQVNIGAGTIVCNYDGAQKHTTVIGDSVCIGADSQLVAPITISENAIIGAGTTVTQDVSAGETVISRIRQFSIKKCGE